MTVSPVDDPNRSVQMTVEQLKSLGSVPNIVYRQKDPVSGRRGCFQSHQFVAQMLLNSNDPYWFIFEEDAELVSNTSAINAIEKIKQIQTIDSEWDYINLGALFDKIDQTYENKTIVKTNSFIESHAYLLSRNGAAKIVQWNFTIHAFDVEFQHHENIRSYIIRPSVFLQRHIYPTNGGGFDMKYQLTRLGLGNAVVRIRLMQEDGSIWILYFVLIVAWLFFAWKLFLRHLKKLF